MRIISGNFKNKKLFFPKNLKTRPLKDSVRENLFNILEHSNDFEIKIKNSHVMDLYAGAGSFGFECLSREASQVYIVEKGIAKQKNVKLIYKGSGYILIDGNLSDNDYIITTRIPENLNYQKIKILN